MSGEYNGDAISGSEWSQAENEAMYQNNNRRIYLNISGIEYSAMLTETQYDITLEIEGYDGEDGENVMMVISKDDIKGE